MTPAALPPTDRPADRQRAALNELRACEEACARAVQRGSIYGCQRAFKRLRDLTYAVLDDAAHRDLEIARHG